MDGKNKSNLNLALYFAAPVFCQGVLLLLSRAGMPLLGPWLLAASIFHFWNKSGIREGERIVSNPARLFGQNPPVSGPGLPAWSCTVLICIGVYLCNGLFQTEAICFSAADFLTAVVAVPLWEEMLYRGFLLQKRMIRVGDAALLLLSSLLFAVAHPGWTGMAAAGIFALLQGLLLLRYHSLIWPLATHILVNAASYLRPPLNGKACLPALILPAGLIVYLAVSVFGRKSNHPDTKENL